MLPFTTAYDSSHSFMYQHGFQDLDGHIWEIFFMDESAIPSGASETVKQVELQKVETEM
jgi:hypothetical protein